MVNRIKPVPLVTGATATATATGLAYVLNALCPTPSYALCPMSYATLDIGYWIIGYRITSNAICRFLDCRCNMNMKHETRNAQVQGNTTCNSELPRAEGRGPHAAYR
jgi:hypothetical protein